MVAVSPVTPAPAPALSPASLDERIAPVDALRGVALLGVLLVNLLTEFRLDLFGYYFTPRSNLTPSDRAIEWAVSVFLEFKAFTLFSFLFGLGLAAQAERVPARGVPFRTFALRRLGTLLAIGLLHLTLVWNGDILTEYAVVGLLVAPAIRLAPTRALLGASLACFALQCVSWPWPWPLPWLSGDALARHVADAQRSYGAGATWETALAFRLRELPYILTLLVHVLPRTAGLFLLGAAAWRKGWVRAPLPARALGVGLAGFAAGGLATVARMRGAEGAWVDLTATLGMALGYAAVVLVLARARRGWFEPFEAVGRMALTNYLMQSLVLGWVFYGWGLGRFGTMGAAEGLALGLGLFAAQAALSVLWLRKYRFGPVEWLWRVATYGGMARGALRRA